MSGLRSTAVSSCGGASRVVVVAITLAAALVALGPVPAMASPVAVQDGDPTGSVDSESLPAGDENDFDGRSTQDTVRLVVGSLIAIAVGTAVMMVVFVWHTSPRRRLRVATRRAERRRAEAASAKSGVAEPAPDDDRGLLVPLVSAGVDADVDGNGSGEPAGDEPERVGDIGSGDDEGVGESEETGDAEVTEQRG